MRHIIIVCIPYAQWRAKLIAKKVFGSGYKISVRTSDYPFPGGLREELMTLGTELIILAITWMGLWRVAPGDHTAVDRWWQKFEATLRRYLKR